MFRREPEEFKTLKSNVERAEIELFKRMRGPGNDKMNTEIGVIIRSNLCPSLIAVIGKGFKTDGKVAYHIWDWIESYADAAGPEGSLEAMKISISTLNGSSYKDNKDRKLRTFFCHALK